MSRRSPQRFPFAPGVIEGMPTCHQPGRVGTITFCAVVVVGLVVLFAVGGFALGYLNSLIS